MKQRPCRQEDFSTDPSKPAEKFNTLTEAQAFALLFTDKFLCLDETSITMFGSSNDPVAQVFTATFIACDKAKNPTCKDKKEVQQWMQNKLLFIGHNKFSF